MKWLWNQFITILSLWIILIALIAPRAAHADTDKSAHFGMSYLVAATSYGMYKKMFHMDRPSALIFSLVSSTVLVNFIEMQSKTIDNHDIIANQMGVLTFGFSALVFEF